MALWKQWWNWCEPLQAACARKRTFYWMATVLAAFCVREDLWGVTSFVRTLGLDPWYYDRLLDFFHSPALDIEALTVAWTGVVLRRHPGLLRCNGRLILLGDGLKAPRAGKKMPAVKKLHQPSESNTKPAYIMGHSFQAVAVAVSCLNSIAAIPLAARIHEGVLFSNRDQRTLLDKMASLLESLRIQEPYYFVADAYYATQKIVRAMLRGNNHLVTRVRNNAVAYLPAPPAPAAKRGRPRKYGDKIALKSLFGAADAMTVPSPVYGDKNVTITVWSRDLLWRPVGIAVRFVAVEHPLRGRILLMTTDLNLSPIDVVRLYGYRFKIEVSFKGAVRSVGVFAYHFWMKQMTPIKRNADNQYLHRKSKSYRDAVRRKLAAYHRFVQLGLIAQGILLALSTTVPERVWGAFGSWFRTIRPGICPSEAASILAMRNTLPEFLGDSSPAPNIAKFIVQRFTRKKPNKQKIAA